MIDRKQICQNCGKELKGEYCSKCGQRDKDFRAPMKELSQEVLEEFLSFDKRLLRSLKPFLLKPGFLTLQYLSGKRKQYISPFKMYFFVSFLFFFLIAVNDSETTYVTNAGIHTYDSLKTSTENDTIFAVVDGKKTGVRFTFSDSPQTGKIGKVLGFDLSAGLKKLKSNPQLFFDKMKEYRPKIIFLLLPVFALLLKLLYFRSKNLYITHLVFSFYFHSFVFAILLFIDLLELTGLEFFGSYSIVFLFAIPLNLYLGMKRVYQQSRGKTIAKLFLLAGSYSVTFLFAFFVAMLIFLRIYFT